MPQAAGRYSLQRTLISLVRSLVLISCALPPPCSVSGLSSVYSPDALRSAVRPRASVASTSLLHLGTAGGTSMTNQPIDLPPVMAKIRAAFIARDPDYLPKK